MFILIMLKENKCTDSNMWQYKLGDSNMWQYKLGNCLALSQITCKYKCMGTTK